LHIFDRLAAKNTTRKRGEMIKPGSSKHVLLRGIQRMWVPYAMQLARYAGLSQSYVRQLCRELENSTLISRVFIPGKPKLRWKLTPEGEQILDDLNKRNST
jgi:DNA-binding MarR family transcriptional regulator